MSSIKWAAFVCSEWWIVMASRAKMKLCWQVFLLLTLPFSLFFVYICFFFFLFSLIHSSICLFFFFFFFFLWDSWSLARLSQCYCRKEAKRVMCNCIKGEIKFFTWEDQLMTKRARVDYEPKSSQSNGKSQPELENA